MEITVGKKKFKLEKVSIYISDLYVEYVNAANEALTVDGDFEEAKLVCEVEREEAESKADRIRADLKLFRALKSIKKESSKASIGCTKMRNNILKEIVELNGYEFDTEAWLKSISEDDFNEIIGSLMNGKKKVTASST